MDDERINIDGHELKLTNLDKVFWPDDGYTKGDLIYYYFRIAPYILPHLKDRPLTLKRYPNGIKEPLFFQKDVAGQVSDWIQTKKIYSESTGENIEYILCNDTATLIYLANLAVITQNPWLSHWPTLDVPDYFVLDLDPQEGATFSNVVEVALLVKEELDKLNLKGWLKTSGASGIHIYVALKPVYTYKQARQFAMVIAKQVNKKEPKLTTIEHFKSKRQGRVYIDYLQNIKSKTLASVYSVRARSGAPVSAPLEWSELNANLSPNNFTMFNIFDRLKKKGDIFLHPPLQGEGRGGDGLLATDNY